MSAGPAVKSAIAFFNQEILRIDEQRRILVEQRDALVSEMRNPPPPMVKPASNPAHVIAIVEQAPGRITYSQITAALKRRNLRVPPATVRSALARAAKYGYIARVARGTYTAIPTADRARGPVEPKKVRRHNLETLQRVPAGWRCPGCGVEHTDRTDFVSIECRRAA